MIILRMPFYWKIADPSKAYSRTVVWENGDTTLQGSFESPQLLFHQKGIPTYLFAARANNVGGFRNATKNWCMVIPLKNSC